MTPYVVTEGMIPEEDIELFRKIRLKVENLPDLDLGIDENGEKIILSCHILARAISNVFRIRCLDGYFCNCRHSWLITPNNNIIDVYPVYVVGGPIIYSNNHLSPARGLYKCDFTLCQWFKNDSFDRAVDIVTRAMPEPDKKRHYPRGICLGS